MRYAAEFFLDAKIELVASQSSIEVIASTPNGDICSATNDATAIVFCQTEIIVVIYCNKIISQSSGLRFTRECEKHQPRINARFKRLRRHYSPLPNKVHFS